MDGLQEAIGPEDQRWARALVDAAPDGVLVVDVGGRAVYANARLGELAGYDPEELVGEPVEVLVPELRRDLEENLSTRDVTLLRKDGSEMPVEVSLAPMHVDGAQWSVAVVRDTSARVARENERRRLLHLLQYNPDGVVVVDAASLEVEYVNVAAAALKVWDAAELIGPSVGALEPSTNEERLRAWIARLAAGDAGAEFLETTVHAAEDEEVPVELRTRLITGPDGSRHVITVVRDLRPRRAEEELLRVSEQSFRTAFEGAPIAAAVSSLSPKGNRLTVMANQALANLLGTTVAELIGHSLDDLTHPDDRPREADLLRQLAAGDLEQFPLRKRMRRADGSEIWVEVRYAAIALPGVAGPLALTHELDVSDLVDVQRGQARVNALTECVAEVTTAVLAEEEWHDTLNRIVQGAATMLGADGAALALGAVGTGALHIEAQHGEVLAGLDPATPLVWAVLDLEGADHTGESGPGATDALSLPAPPPGVPEPLASTLGPMAFARFEHVDGRPGGYLCVVRRRGAREFTPEDCDDLARLASQTRLALQLSWARHVQERLALIEERQRIGRDLHDVVVQDVIALGMEILARTGHVSDAERAQEDREVVSRLEDVVHSMRQVVLELRGAGDFTLRNAVRDLAAHAGRSLGHAPEVTFEGDIDSLDRRVADDLLGVLREALSNVARHAGAQRTQVHLAVSEDAVTLTVVDDGDGIPSVPPAGQGLGNIRQRASSHGGWVSIEADPDGGTRLVWSLPGTRGSR